MSFYRIKIDEGKGKPYALARPYDATWMEQIHCEVCGRLWKRDNLDLVNNQIEFPIILTNENFADFINCANVDLISQRAKELMEMAVFKDYTLLQLPVIPKDEIPEDRMYELNAGSVKAKNISNQTPNYYRMMVTIGANLHEDSWVEWRDGCGFCEFGKGYRKKNNNYKIPNFIIFESWRGNDLFRVEESETDVYCTERFKEFYYDNSLTGLDFIPVEER